MRSATGRAYSARRRCVAAFPDSFAISSAAEDNGVCGGPMSHLAAMPLEWNMGLYQGGRYASVCEGKCYLCAVLSAPSDRH